MLQLKQFSNSENETKALQSLLNSAPTYAQIATGQSASPTAAQEMLTALPSGKKYDEKFVLGAYHNENLIGCVDLIRGFPTPTFAYIGLLLIAEPQEGKGYGAKILELVQKQVLQWPECITLRLGVLATNKKAIAFWTKLGFKPTGEVKPYHCGQVSTKVHLYQCELRAAA